jgi:hypothetical protein
VDGTTARDAMMALRGKMKESRSMVPGRMAHFAPTMKSLPGLPA